MQHTRTSAATPVFPHTKSEATPSPFSSKMERLISTTMQALAAGNIETMKVSPLAEMGLMLHQ